MGKRSNDVEETSTWSCPTCGIGNTCAPGDESVALMIHMLVHTDEDG